MFQEKTCADQANCDIRMGTRKAHFVSILAPLSTRTCLQSSKQCKQFARHKGLSNDSNGILTGTCLFRSFLYGQTGRAESQENVRLSCWGAGGPAEPRLGQAEWAGAGPWPGAGREDRRGSRWAACDLTLPTPPPPPLPPTFLKPPPLSQTPGWSV